MPRYTGTIVEHVFRTFEYEAGDFDLAKDHLDTLLCNRLYSDWDVLYDEAEVVGINQVGI